MLYKLQRALIRGTLLEELIAWCQKIRHRTDWMIGCITRYFASICTSIDNRQIMFITFQGDYTCNPKYIVEELLRNNFDGRIVFSARRSSIERIEFPKEIYVVEQYTMEFYQEIMRSKILVVNSVEFMKKPVHKKKGQIWIETWHGSLGIKRFDKEHNKGKAWVKAAERLGRLTDYIVSNSEFENDVYRKSFWENAEILEYGHPRNDLLFQENNELKSRILMKINEIEEGIHYALYAPTFRDNHSLEIYNINYPLLLNALHKRFGGKWKILLRIHPTVRKKSEMLYQTEGVINVTSYSDIQELMCIADVAITDYSSWIFDFMLTRKAGFIYAIDTSSYELERGFYYPLSETPFPIANSNDELVNNIISFDYLMYQREVNKFLENKGCWEDGKAAERMRIKIMEKLGQE